MSAQQRHLQYEENDQNYRYICERGHRFDEPGYTKEYEEHFGGRFSYEITCCPICGGGYYDTRSW